MIAISINPEFLDFRDSQGGRRRRGNWTGSNACRIARIFSRPPNSTRIDVSTLETDARPTLAFQTLLPTCFLFNRLLLFHESSAFNPGLLGSSFRFWFRFWRRIFSYGSLVRRDEDIFAFLREVQKFKLRIFNAKDGTIFLFLLGLHFLFFFFFNYIHE